MSRALEIHAAEGGRNNILRTSSSGRSSSSIPRLASNDHRQQIRPRRQYPWAFRDRILLSHLGPGGSCTHFKPEQLVAPQVQNWPLDDLLRDVDGLTVGMILWLANLCYGVLHAMAWNSHFPSVTEKWLWRASATYIGFCGGLWVTLNFLVSRWPKWNEFWDSWVDGKKMWWHNVLIGTLVVVCGFAFLAARAYIVTEALLSLRSLPLDAYQTPSWIQTIPHF